MITQTLKLNLIPGQVLPRVNVSQYDAGTRTLQMLLYNGDQAFNIPVGYGGFVQGTKPDRTGFQYAATVTEGSNVVTLVVTQQMAAVSGEVTCELVIANGDDRIATVNFILYVEPAALADDTVISDTELPLIEEAAELAQRIDGIAADVEADADRAEAAADNAELWASRNPYIGQNGNWFVFDTTTETYVDTQIPATGPQGPQGDDGPTGPQGPTGPTGNGIVSITKTGTSGLVDTYTITFTDGTTTTFTVTNGQDGQGSGDMTKAVYDSTNAVADAGGIVAYVASQAGAGSLSGLSDVSLSTLANGESLVYNSTSQKWENGSVSYSSLSGKPTLGTAAAKDSTNAVTSGSTDLVESGAVYSELALKADSEKAYQTDDTTETTLASDDIIPFYDTSATAKRKMTVQKFGEQLISNPNLLDNPWFTVNQRGATSLSAYGYGVDRWEGIYTVNASGNGLDFVNTNYIIQPLEQSVKDFLHNKTVTLSIMLSDGTIYKGTNVYKKDADVLLISTAQGGGKLNAASFSGIDYGISFTALDNITVRAVKLELGSVSTLAMDTAPNYAIELAKCKASTADPNDTYANQGQLVFTKVVDINNSIVTSDVGTVDSGNTKLVQWGNILQYKLSVTGLTVAANTWTTIAKINGYNLHVNNLAMANANDSIWGIASIENDTDGIVIKVKFTEAVTGFVLVFSQVIVEP